MKIRKEQPNDYNAVYDVVKAAFMSAEHSNGTEQDLVNALRTSDAFVPELSLVAEIEDKIVGHILFTEVTVGGETALALAPLAVAPEHQKTGIGTALIRAGHEKAREMGYSYSIVLGSETYYPRSGYVCAQDFGIEAPFDVPSENFMAYRLSEDAPKLHGTVKYAKEFGIE